MTVLWILLVSIVVLGGGGVIYSRLIGRWLGEDNRRPVPSIAKADGRDYVATPTPVLFAHHFATIAGAGPIVGPVIAIAYGWLPALLWVLVGALFFGAVHDYLAVHMATREGGQSVATILRRLVGRRAFLLFGLFIIVMLSLVTAMFLNLSASALTSIVQMDFLKVTSLDGFRTATVRDQAGINVPGIIIGGIASTSVIIITAFAPLVGWLYIKKHVAVWKCSILAIALCAVSITVGVFYPVSLDPLTWKLLLGVYVLLAAGLPVWLFLQSRDFINVHILYVGLAVLVAILGIAAVTGAGHAAPGEAVTLTKLGLPLPTEVQMTSVDSGERITGLPLWPMLFITIACGAVSGFHSLAAGGTTCKQINSERAARTVGFYAMLLEGFLAVCVIAVLVIGLDMSFYVQYVHPKIVDIMKAESNPVLAFAMAVGWAAHAAGAKVGLAVPIVVGTLAGMILLEGFLVTTLDSAVRLMRYIFEEIWQDVFGRYDVFAAHAPAETQPTFLAGESAAAGSGGIPAGAPPEAAVAFARPIPTSGLFRQFLKLIRHYWFNSGLAVGLMLLFALTGGAQSLWAIFATANQLLAAMVLLLASLWLLRQGKRKWFAFAPALFMLATTCASLVILFQKFSKNPMQNLTLLVADIVIIILTVLLLAAGWMATIKVLRERKLVALAAK